MPVYYTQPTGAVDDYTNILANGSFKIRDPVSGKFWKIDTILNPGVCVVGSGIKLNTGTDAVFTVEKPQNAWTPADNFAAIKTGSTYLRHCALNIYNHAWTNNNYDYSWKIYKQSNGRYQFFSPYGSAASGNPPANGYYIGYDSVNDRVKIVTQADASINWEIVFTNPAPSSSPEAATPGLQPSAPSSGMGSPISSPSTPPPPTTPPPPRISPAPSPKSTEFDFFNVDTWPWWAWLVLVIFILLIVGGGVYAVTR